MKWLLANGATVDKDDLGGTPLHDAAEHGSIEVCKNAVRCSQFETLGLKQSLRCASI